jgi:SNF2 family DNA or RNA helicase
MIDYKYKSTPFKHQSEDFLRSRDLEEFALFWEMGLGKSKTTIDTIAWLWCTGMINAAFIVANKGSYRNWVAKELPEHMPDHVDWVGTYWDSLASTELKKSYDLLLRPSDKLKIFVMNIEALAFPRSMELAASFVNCHKTFMVVDESTTIKNRDAKRTRAAIAIGKLAAYRRILTGTPITQSPLDLYSQAQFLNPVLLGYTSYYSFRAKFADMVKITAGNRAFTKITGYRNLDELNKIMQPWSSRRTKAECLDLPAKVYQTYEVELTPEQQRHYKTLKDDAIAVLEGRMVSAPIVLTKILRLHQLVCGHLTTDDGKVFPIPNNRLAALMDILDETQGKVIIWANYIADIKAIVEGISKGFPESRVVAYHGSVNSEDRAEAVRAFCNDLECRFFVGNTATGGLGLTLTAAKTVVYYSNNYDLGSRMQSEDRAHRIGQDQSVTYVDLISPKTIDEKIVSALRQKKKLSAEVLGDEWREWLL